MTILEDFIEDLRCRGFTPHTIESYRSNVKYFFEFYPGIDADISLLRKFLGHLRNKGLSKKTISAYFSSISSLYDFLVFEGKFKINPVLVFRRRYLRYKVQYGGENTRQLISVDEMRCLINSAEDILDRTMMLFLAKTGLRRGELISMDIQDIDLETGEFRIKPKAKRTNRLGFLDPELIDAMRDYLDWRSNVSVRGLIRYPEILEDRNALWITHTGHRVSRNYVYYSIVNHAQAMGFHDPHGTLNKKFTPHCFRHWFTTHLRRAGMSREFIQELRGDHRKDAIDIYDHIDPEELRLDYLRYIPRIMIPPMM